MAELGADTLLVCSNVAAGRDRRPRAVGRPAAPAGRGGAAARRADRLRGAGLGHGTSATTATPGRIVERADHPGARHLPGLLPHPLARQRPGRASSEIPGDKIFFLQLADAPGDGHGRAPVEPPLPLLPGPGRLRPGRPSWATCRPRATTGRGRWRSSTTHFRQAEPERIAVDARRSLLALGEQIGRSAACRPPREPSGFAFAELAVGPESGDRAAERCWRPWASPTSGPHRSKPVQLSGARATRACCSTTATSHAGDDALVSALGVESADPDGAAARAEALGAALLPRRRGPGEADLAAIAAPDDTTVLFCRTDARARTCGWATSWSSTSRRRRRLRHRRRRPRRALAAVRLLRRGGAVLPLGARPGAARGPGRGGARRPARSRARSRRPHGPRCGWRSRCRGWAAATAGSASSSTSPSPSDDVARRPRAGCASAGVPLLAIPDNYYDDLAARTELERRAHRGAARARRAVRRRRRGGEFLHLFTEMVGDRLFFEVVERRGGYDGYGAANSPVRLAAQLQRRTGGRGVHA